MKKDSRNILIIAYLLINVCGIILLNLPFISAKLGGITLKTYSGFDISYDFNNNLFKEISKNEIFIGFIRALFPLLMLATGAISAIVLLIINKKDEWNREYVENVKHSTIASMVLILLSVVCILFSKNMLGIEEVSGFVLDNGSTFIIITLIISGILRFVIDDKAIHMQDNEQEEKLKK